MTVPIVSVFRQTYPEVKITVLTTKFFSELFNQIPNINFLYFEKKHKNIKGLVLLTNAIKNIKADYIIDLHNVIRTNIINFLINPFNIFKTSFFKLKKGRREKKRLIKGGKLKKLKTMHQRYADVFTNLDLSLDLKKFTSYKKVKISNTNIDFHNFKNFIGIAPFAKHSCKEYSLTNILKIIDSINQDTCVILFGAPGNEQYKLEKISDKKQNVYSIAGKLSLSQEMAVISNLDLMISMDSANGHIATLFGIKVISIWGATHPYLGYAPFGQPEGNSITVDLKKYPNVPATIYGRNCPENCIDAINSISPEKIISMIK